MDTKTQPAQSAPPAPPAQAAAARTDTTGAAKRPIDQQVVFVLQGGGALGAFQAGVYQALHEAGVEPDWAIGTSIGAINGSIVAGNRPADRLPRLRQFWEQVGRHGPLELARLLSGGDNTMSNLATLTQGIPGFFTPNPAAWFGTRVPLGVERAGFYSVSPLRDTLLSLVDFAYLGEKHTRLTVGMVNVRSGRMCYYTNRDTALSVEHLLASAALPPGFPAIRIDGEAYWDGGICSNTPIEAVLDDHPRRSSVIFAVQLWPLQGPEPDTIWEAMGRQRDIQYSSRAETQLEHQRQLHRLRHVIRELAKHIPQAQRSTPAVEELLGWGCHTTMHVVELNAPPFGGEDLTKDIDFSAAGIQARWNAGYVHGKQAIEAAPWRGALDPIEGIAVHVPLAPA
ncbi:patatin-like phospholipase family protein [Cupriavidus sp. CV2]|uniref:patatin-like phospholipase family protein n=1 Tax=Cupriavidus ulmosensis TaxID=3065913 RepID=UPI00296AA399|nr:patatin-like phospholipase family protein [Cupriavidus sp. CV2]MDW3688623.1 patatin-like phospholipase family protein [Cupriavidus sp. CV2]